MAYHTGLSVCDSEQVCKARHNRVQIVAVKRLHKGAAKLLNAVPHQLLLEPFLLELVDDDQCCLQSGTEV